MHKQNIKDPRLLEAYYLNKIFDIIESFKLKEKNYAGEYIVEYISYVFRLLNCTTLIPDIESIPKKGSCLDYG